MATDQTPPIDLLTMIARKETPPSSMQPKVLSAQAMGLVIVQGWDLSLTPDGQAALRAAWGK